MQIKLLTTHFYYMISYLIKISAYTHVTFKQTELSLIIKVILMKILILKAIDSAQKPKSFSSQFSLRAFKRYICIYKERKEHKTEENRQPVNNFSKTNLFREWMKKFTALWTKKKEKMTINESKNDDSDILQALYSVYKKIRTILFPYLLICLNEDISQFF